MRQVFTTQEVKFLLEENLLKKYPEIVGFSVQKSSPEKIIIYCENEETAKRVPPIILGRKVITKVIGKVYALAIDKKGVFEKLIGGISISDIRPVAGTLGIILKDFDGKPIGLTNRHVLMKNTKVFQPGFFDAFQKNILNNEVGKLKRYIEIKAPPEKNLVDAAIFEVYEEFFDKNNLEKIINIGKIKGIRSAKLGERVKKEGRNCYGEGIVTDVNATIKVYGYEGMEYAIFEDQIVIEPPIMSPGDSGSAILSYDNYLVALGFAGSNKVSIANKIENVFKLLKLPYRMAPPIPLWVIILALLIGSLFFYSLFFY